MIKTLFLTIFFVNLAGCSYIGTMLSQVDYLWRQQASPQQRIYKHMLDHETFFVFGKIEHAKQVNQEATAIVALSDRFRDSEVVDVNHMVRPGSYYSLYLPAGDYRLLVVSDLDRDGYYQQNEVIGGRTVSLTEDAAPNKVMSRYNIDLARRVEPVKGPFQVSVLKNGGGKKSLFYPNGTIRSLADPIFSPQMATLGMYQPAAFLEAAPMMFYALEEDHFYKVPVIFVPGIGGSVRVFNDILANLDRTRFRPWFFYYPTGADLNQLSAMFYTLFLSGKVLPLDAMPLVIVAHSMGGLVVREALNLRTGSAGENHVQRLITIASPMGGLPSARAGEKAPVVIPAWRDINPDSEFIKGLYRKPLPPGAEYHLMFAYGNNRGIKLGANSDGAVVLTSQLSPPAQREATTQHGFDATHMGILKNQETIQEIIRIVGEVRAPYPEPYMRELMKGGYHVELTSHYKPLEEFYIQNMGFFMEALASGELAPLQPGQAHFVRALRGQVSPHGEMETGWIKFIRDYPDRSALVQYAAGETDIH